MILMREVEFVCPKCGTSFTVKADYFIPGVQGFWNEITFVDPTKPRHCPKCCEEFIAILREDLCHEL